ncbi:BspA family leucine-rich repeat surface protein [Xylocopilactobacillus apis]|uniref:Surface protein n=1 Tax=Xylocopilactobacillus apis TaxID=2932183 RepID=A0AAU9DT55_9LACO|nr:BspA family leucine-rich repeat surface protein [Xylocopilactobacillus apis]BDR56928.1 hypothetical protein KIMC2_14900 [Xylocopilactobacillus apis]
MNKIIKRIGYLIVAIVSIATIGVVLNNKQDSKAADFPHSASIESNGIISGKREDSNKQISSNFLDLTFPQNAPYKQNGNLVRQTAQTITARDAGSVVQTGDFRLIAESQFNNGQSLVNLNWSAVSGVTDGFFVERTLNNNLTQWTVPPTNYGKHIKILNVYPPNGNFLQIWMNQDNGSGQPVSMGLIDVTPVALETFNANPGAYLKDSSGKYVYDGIYFGSADGNGGLFPPETCDLTASSYAMVADFGNTGRSLIFGHDTLNYYGHPYFNKFADKVGFILSSVNPSLMLPGYHVDADHFTGSTQVKFSVDGFLNRYPYNMDPSINYTIKAAHTSGQYFNYTSGATRWMQFVPPLTQFGGGGTAYAADSMFDPQNKKVGDSNSYLVTKNNYAMIQTGHSVVNGIGACTPDEAKIIANMTYYTSNLNMTTHGEDHTVKDSAAPDVPTIDPTSATGNTLNLKFNSKDNATDHYYRVKANVSLSTKYSDTLKVPVISGFKGYVYQIDDNPTGSPTVNKDPSSGTVTNINLNPTSATDNHGNLSLNRVNAAGKYLHIVAVDNANNVSAAKTVNLSDYLWWNVDSNNVLTIYPHELNWDRDHVNYYDIHNIYQSAWPWYQSYNTITKVVVSPGVTAQGSLYRLFYNLSSATAIEGCENLVTTQVTNMSEMFNSCSRLTSVDVSKFNTSAVTNMSFMFSYCGFLNNLDVTHFDTSKVNNMNYMFNGCSRLTSLDVTNFVTSSVTNMGSMFNRCNQLTSLDVTRFDTSRVYDMSYMFNSCSRLTSLDVTHFVTNVVINMSHMFSNCFSLPTIDVTHFNTGMVNNMNSMFANCSLFTGLNVTNFDTSKVTDMSSMFYSCSKLLNLDINNFDTSQVTNMSSMFSNCSAMTDLKFDLDKFKTSNVTNMSNMFYSCSVLKSLDVSKFDTSNVVDMNELFASCSSLTKLDVSHFNTANVSNMVRVFAACEGLTSIDVNGAGWSTNNVTNISGLFNGCKKLTSLNLTKFNTRNIVSTNIVGIFANTKSLWKITMGPDFVFFDSYVSNQLKDPDLKAQINDIDNPTPIYYVTNPQWREVGAGNPHEPQGPALTALQIMNESSTRHVLRTYVWDQVGTQTLAATPGSINFGTYASYLRNKEYVSAVQNLKITDNRNVRTGKRWHVEAAVTNPFKLTTNPSKVIRGNPLYYKDTTAGTITHLTSTGQTIYNGTGTSDYEDVKNYPWTLRFRSKPSDIPKAGRYNATVTFTLVNNAP